MSTKTKKLDTTVAESVATNLVNYVGNLYDRWQDEKEYEDFKDYSEAMEKALNETKLPVTFKRATKRPFGFKFIDNNNANVEFSLVATAKSIRLDFKYLN